ncbi:hypothetical protein HBE96_20625 [Clostridium sp. P21]|uniref:Uncharacterized protein n=1 Tax=Clostridium muellerianum TaxID=2716538 RepID=A0A7Y0EK81_9CLOT|nr:hypothetical protein [Clostridium muellerianum]NMM64999.1 hypothetical protein [Clostridium muellerianum]
MEVIFLYISSDEIRKLAEQSKNSTEEIKKIIEDIQKISKQLSTEINRFILK